MERVDLRDGVAENGGALGEAHAADGGQVLDRVGKAVERADRAAGGELGVMFARLREQAGTLLQGDDRVDPRVERVDPVEEGGHHLHAGNAATADRPGELDRPHIDYPRRLSRG